MLKIAKIIGSIIKQNVKERPRIIFYFKFISNRFLKNRIVFTISYVTVLTKK